MKNKQYICNDKQFIDTDADYNINKKNELLTNENILYFDLDLIIGTINLYIITFLLFALIAKHKEVKVYIIFSIFLFHSILCFFFYIYTLYNVSDASTYYFFSLYDYNCSSYFENRFGYKNTLSFVNLLQKLGLNYLGVFIVFNFIGSIGIIFLYLSLKIINFSNERYVNYLIYFIIFFPSLHFWSSGIGKDAIVFCFTTIIFYLFLNKKSYFYILLCILTIFLVRPYCAILITLALLVHYLYINQNTLRNKLIVSVFFLFIIISFNQYFLNLIYFSEIFNFKNIIQYINNQRSYLQTDSQNLNIINIFYEPIIYLFKPIILNTKSNLLLISSVENIILLLISIYIFSKINLKNLYNLIIKKNIFFFCYFLLILIPLSLTTLNYGLIVRLKIMILVPYFILLTLIYQSYIFNKIKKT